jgi:hypothetical protein
MDNGITLRIPSEIWSNIINHHFKKEHERHVFRFLNKFFHKLIHKCRYRVTNTTVDNSIEKKFNIQKSLEAIALSGNSNLFQWLFEWGRYISVDIFRETEKEKIVGNVILSGNIELLEYIKGKKYKFNRKDINGAIKKGNISLLKWLKHNEAVTEKEWFVNPEYLCESAKSNQFEILKWLKLENNCPWTKTSSPSSSSLGQKLDNFKSELSAVTSEELKKNGYSLYGLLVNNNNNIDECNHKLPITNHRSLTFHPNYDSFPSALVVEYGTFEMLKWCIENGCPWNEWACANAAKILNFEILKWSIENQCPWNEYTYVYAAGNREIFMWCIENKGIPINTNIRKTICAMLAKVGNLELLKWCKNEANFEFDMETCYYATQNDNLEILKWCLENGYELDGLIYSIAVQNNCLNILEWLVSQNTDSFHSICYKSLTMGNPKVLEWVLGKGYPWNPKFYEIAAFYGNLNVLKWCKSQGYLCDSWNQVCKSVRRSPLFANIKKAILEWCFSNID